MCKSQPGNDLILIYLFLHFSVSVWPCSFVSFFYSVLIWIKNILYTASLWFFCCRPLRKWGLPGVPGLSKIISLSYTVQIKVSTRSPSRFTAAGALGLMWLEKKRSRIVQAVASVPGASAALGTGATTKHWALTLGTSAPAGFVGRTLGQEWMTLEWNELRSTWVFFSISFFCEGFHRATLLCLN